MAFTLEQLITADELNKISRAKRVSIGGLTATAFHGKTYAT